jgi:hypothetical protein
MKHLQPLGNTTRLGSPSFTNGKDGIPWLKEFVEKCSSCQIDFVQAHWYGGGMADFKPYIEDFHKAFPDKPVWLTEFGLNEGATPEAEFGFLEQALKFLDQTDYVARYAFFMAAPLQEKMASKALVFADASLTPLGELYNSG